MTRALADMEAGRFDAAAAGLDAAARLRADDPAVADARRRLAAGRQRAELARLRKQVVTRERAEDWAGAVTIYEKALAQAPSAGFAREGIERARERARLNEQVDYYLDDPERLYSPDPLAHAERLIDSAGTVPADEPKLEAKVEELERHVRVARRPLLLTMRSDGETEVAIYHVARLGRFEERSLELPPGTYTVVGSRPWLSRRQTCDRSDTGLATGSRRRSLRGAHLNRLYVIRDTGGERRVGDDALPLEIGGAGADVVVPTRPVGEVTAYVALSDGHPYVQPASGDTAGDDLFLNHERLTGSAWLKSGDTIELDEQVINWTVSGDQVFIDVRARAGALVPPPHPPPGCRRHCDR